MATARPQFQLLEAISSQEQTRFSRPICVDEATGIFIIAKTRVPHEWIRFGNATNALKVLKDHGKHGHISGNDFW